jgi:sensor c-di-GMP phosphodiesterase-like protein
MAQFISLLIDKSHARLLGFGLWLAMFLLTLVLAAGLFAFQVNQTMIRDSQKALEPQIKLRENIASTVAIMQKQLSAEPCSPLFHEQLREIAFLPDGLNEFLYAPDGVAQCSVSSNFAPVDLGAADTTSEQFGFKLWYDKSLDFLGRPGLTGNIVLFGDFAVVVPPQPEPEINTEWMQVELVAFAANGAFWHRGGQFGLLQELSGAGPWANLIPFANGSFYSRVCVPDGGTCLIGKALLTDVLLAEINQILLGIVVCAIVAMGISGQLHTMLRKFWSFEARFLRHFKAQNIVCTYQPIKALASDTISGCEVLVRWRDVDGSIIFPDQFLPIVSRHNLGRELTRFVVERACAELSANVPPQLKLQVNVNIFPADLNAAWLREILTCFDQVSERFTVVVEIVESDEVEIEHAQREIEALRRYGIKTHLDDFGTGYSNIQNLASLALEGVKLDRSFAMSADGSLMSKMLVSTIEMIHFAGHRLTVEGVETEDRLRMLKSTGMVDFVQGYLISRPLDIGRFVTFLEEQNVPERRRPRLVA